MNTLPDFSEYLTGERLQAEEAEWAKTRHYETYADAIMAAAHLFKLGPAFSVLELGCGSGWVPTCLPRNVRYAGVDKSDALLRLAIDKNAPSNCSFTCGDLRDFHLISAADLVCSFAVLKHFGLHEWRQVFLSMLRHARFALFTIQTTDKLRSYDDGIDYHHVWVTEAMIEECLESVGKEVYLTARMRREGFDEFYFIGDKR